MDIFNSALKNPSPPKKVEGFGSVSGITGQGLGRGSSITQIQGPPVPGALSILPEPTILPSSSHLLSSQPHMGNHPTSQMTNPQELGNPQLASQMGPTNPQMAPIPQSNSQMGQIGIQINPQVPMRGSMPMMVPTSQLMGNPLMGGQINTMVGSNMSSLPSSMGSNQMGTSPTQLGNAQLMSASQLMGNAIMGTSPTSSTAPHFQNVASLNEKISDSSISKKKKNSRRKHRNSHLGCGTCKKRRIKCDETLPACLNCLKGKLNCAYLNLDSNARNVLRMAQFNQTLRKEKMETTKDSKDNSPEQATSPGLQQQQQQHQQQQMLQSPYGALVSLQPMMATDGSIVYAATTNMPQSNSGPHQQQMVAGSHQGLQQSVAQAQIQAQVQAHQQAVAQAQVQAQVQAHQQAVAQAQAQTQAQSVHYSQQYSQIPITSHQPSAQILSAATSSSSSQTSPIMTSAIHSSQLVDSSKKGISLPAISSTTASNHAIKSPILPPIQDPSSTHSRSISATSPASVSASSSETHDSYDDTAFNSLSISGTKPNTKSESGTNSASSDSLNGGSSTTEKVGDSKLPSIKNLTLAKKDAAHGNVPTISKLLS